MGFRASARGVCLAPLVLLAAAGTAAAKTITVNTTHDAAPTKGACTAHHTCSLRQAVAVAASGDTVSLPANRHRHYVLTFGAINVTKRLTIRGGGAKHTVIDGHGGNGVFILNGGTKTSPLSLALERVTITGSKAKGESFGGHPYNDSGAIVTNGFGNLKLANCVISGNTATAPGSDGSVVGGAVDAEAGGVTISHCSITNNRMHTSSQSAVGGGGVVSEGGPLRVIASNISHNKATMTGIAPIIGGGIVSEGGTLTIIRSTIADNGALALNKAPSSDGAGGALSDGGATTIVNATISGNTDVGVGNVNSGGVVAESGAAFTYVTLTRNSGGTGENLFVSGGFQPFGSVIALVPRGARDCLIIGTSSSKGYNFADHTSCGLNAPTDRTVGNPKLAKLANNGGPGPTEAPLSGSPLIDFIPKASCAAGIKTDERGRRRPDDGESACDIGAYEVQDK